jgi:diaminopimelate epimerase
MNIPFAKFQGLSNDFLIVDGRGLSRALPEFARRILSRHTGVGADGLVLVLPARSRKHDARVRFFNADGSEAEMSGNGIRCAGAFLARRRRGGHALRSPLGVGGRALRIETRAGVKALETVQAAEGKWTFRVGMGTPILAPAKIPFKAPDVSAPILGFPLRTARGVWPVTVTSLGNPHCTLFVTDYAALDWASLGREIETHKLFPNRTNVEFAKLISENEIEVRFWERGVGHTTASGTGSCAAAVAGILHGLTGREVHVRTEVGTLEVAWPEKGEISLTGPVELVAQGTYFTK